MRRADQIEVELPQRGWAFDRRSVDSAGRLTATECLVTAATVCPYVGREIPGCEALGLDPQKIYQLYRDPKALKAAMPKLNGQPLMLDHIAVSAANPQQQRIIGTVSDARWDGKRIYATVTVWDSTAITLIETNAQRDLSCGYSYVPDMTNGRTPAGEHFDGVMRSIEFNHVALVETGRVQGATISDALPYHVAMERLCPGYGRLR
ncbi:MAG TPA: DUF2213 domain-containing protein [Steroidobacteraceae bacterium]|jgi:hypothetical protein|nr:DUF2213 domain-containing protein [Steroidobacteraceae bacterium]